MVVTKVSALYIVKNEEEFLPFSIAAIHNAMHEVIVIDNNSNDQTPQKAVKFPKVRLFRSLASDFSELWNLGLQYVTGDWFMFLAADEVFYPDLEQRLPGLVSRKDVDGYYCWFYHLRWISTVNTPVPGYFRLRSDHFLPSRITGGIEVIFPWVFVRFCIMKVVSS